MIDDADEDLLLEVEQNNPRFNSEIKRNIVANTLFVNRE